MKVKCLSIADVKLVTPTRLSDARGFFSETWKQSQFAEIGIPGPFVQDNHAFSRDRSVVRGLHLQIGAVAQGKLVGVPRGAIWDVVVDVRRGSPTYGKHAASVLSAENWRHLWVPVGFLHGYCTLEPNTSVVYKVTAEYDKSAERGVVWNDPDLTLPWPVLADQAIISEKDKALPRLAECPLWFTF